MAIEYNIITEGGKKCYIIKKKTTFKIVQDLLETDYLGTIINDLIEQEGELNKSLVKGSLVSDRRALKKKLAREGIMVDLVLNRFLEYEIPLEQYLFLQQYVGSYIFRTEGAQNLDLKIKRGINEQYFHNKGIKLANLHSGAEWRLESIQDVVKGTCTLGHDIRYAFVAVNNLGERLVFGNTCIHDFFEIDGQLTARLQGYVEDIKDVTDEYYNDYHAYYEIHKNLDKFMYILMASIQKVTGSLFTQQEMSYVKQFVGYELPVPRPLARQVGIKIQTFLNHAFSELYFPKTYRTMQNLIYLLYCVSFGSHGYTKQDLRGFFPTHFLGDRIMPNEVKELDALLTNKYAIQGDNQFVNEMVLNMSEEQFVNIINNVYQVRQLTKAIKDDPMFSMKQETIREIGVYYKSTDICLTDDDNLACKLFGFPEVQSIQEGLVRLVNHKLELSLNKDLLKTNHYAYIGAVNPSNPQELFGQLDTIAERAKEFILDNRDKLIGSNIAVSIIRTGYLTDKNEVAEQWIMAYFKGQGMLNQFKQFANLGEKIEDVEKYRELFQQASDNMDLIRSKFLIGALDDLRTVIRTGKLTVEQSDSIIKIKRALLEEQEDDGVEEDTNKNEYEVLLDKVKANRQLITKHGLEFPLKVLETCARTGKASAKQQVHINKIARVFRGL